MIHEFIFDVCRERAALEMSLPIHRSNADPKLRHRLVREANKRLKLNTKKLDWLKENMWKGAFRVRPLKRAIQ